MDRKPMNRVRLMRELEKILQNPPSGISLVSKGDSTDVLDASIMGMEGTPYASGVFKLEVEIPDKYPLEPPRIRFITPVYHPNVDDAGRICLDLLKLPKNGTWSPVNTLEGVLIAIQQLLANPNPDDPLMLDIANQYRSDKAKFDSTAREWTRKHAFQNLEKQNSKPEKEDSSVQGGENTNVLKRKDHEGDNTHNSKCSKMLKE